MWVELDEDVETKLREHLHASRGFGLLHESLFPLLEKLQRPGPDPVAGLRPNCDHKNGCTAWCVDCQEMKAATDDASRIRVSLAAVAKERDRLQQLMDEVKVFLRPIVRNDLLPHSEGCRETGACDDDCPIHEAGHVLARIDGRK